MNKYKGNSMEKIIRELGNAEYFYYLANKITSTNFSVIFELNESVSLEDLKRSTSQIVETYEKLRIKIIRSSETNLSFVKNEQPNIGIVHKTGSSESLISLIEQEINSSFENENDPFRVTCFTNSDQNSEHIIFTFSHTLTDATAAIMIAQKIILNAFKKDFDVKISKQNVLPNVERVFPKKAKGLLFLRLLYRFVIRKIKFERKYGKLRPLKKGLYNINSRNIKNYRIVIENLEYAQLLEKCRKNKVTVHHILSALQILALRKEYSENGKIPIEISMPVNLRNMLSSKISSDIPGLYISIPSLTIVVDEEENILEIAENVKDILSQKISLGEIFVTFNVLKKSKFPCNEQGIKNLEAMFSKNQPTTMITNVGLIQAIDDKFIPFHSVEFSVAPSKHALLCSSVCSYNNTMIINCCFNVDLLPERDAKLFFERMKKQLNVFLMS